MERAAPLLSLVAVALVLASPPARALVQKSGPKKAGSAADDARARRTAEDQRARSAWSTLTPAEQRDLLDYFALEASQSDALQAALVRFVLKGQDVDPGQWPEADEASRAPHFLPHEHAPAQPIPRQWLADDAPRAVEFRRTVFAAVPERAFESAWTYDYASRELRRGARARDPERLFANALAGFPPEIDLAEALVERALDDGAQQKALTAFGHAYTDREGNAYPGVTLYDAWTSGIEIEMPDVDTLGIIHTVLGDWKTWVAPVSAGDHPKLYGKVGEIYTAAHRHRSLRRALAATFLVGTQPLRDHYDHLLDHLHALWEAHESTPAKLAPKLPASKDWTSFLETWSQKCKRQPKLLKAGTARRAELDASSTAVRASLLRALEEFGAVERLNKRMLGR